MTLTKLLASDGYICLNKAIIKRFGIAVALILGELCAEHSYWESRDSLEDGYFFSTLKNIEDETSIKKSVQQNVFNLLKQYGVIDVKRKNMPARRYVKINEDNLFDFLKLCNEEINDKSNEKQVQKITQSDDSDDIQFTGRQQTSLTESSKQDCCNPANYYNKNNINKNNINNKTLKDKSFSVCGKSHISEETFFDNLENETKIESISEDEEINLISFKEKPTIQDVLVKENKTQNIGPLKDLINTENDNNSNSDEIEDKINSNKEETKPVKPFKLKTKKEKKPKSKPLGNKDRQLELIDIYFNNGVTCNRPDIASLVKQFFWQRVRKIGYKNYSDTRWENQLKMLIENSEGDYEYMAEIIKTSISRDYNDITFIDQKKSLHKFKPQYRQNNSFDTAKDNIKTKGVALLSTEEQEEYRHNSLATDENGNPIEF